MLDIPADTLIRFDRLVNAAESALAAPRAGFGETEAYPAFAIKAGVLCSRLIRNHPLPDGNKRVAYLCLVEFVERNGFEWDSRDPDDVVRTLIGAAARAVSEAELIAWIETRITARAHHGELAMVSAAAIDGESPITMVRYSLDPEDGWWLLGYDDLPVPEVENIRTVCLHCVIDHLEPKVGRGMDVAARDAAASEEGIGIAVWSEGAWLPGDEGLQTLPDFGQDD